MTRIDVVVKQQYIYTSCMKVDSGGNLGLSREYPKKLFGHMFYSWWNCPLMYQMCQMAMYSLSLHYVETIYFAYRNSTLTVSPSCVESIN